MIRLPQLLFLALTVIVGVSTRELKTIDDISQEVKETLVDVAGLVKGNVPSAAGHSGHHKEGGTELGKKTVKDAETLERDVDKLVSETLNLSQPGEGVLHDNNKAYKTGNHVHPNDNNHNTPEADAPVRRADAFHNVMGLAQAAYNVFGHDGKTEGTEAKKPEDEETEETEKPEDEETEGTEKPEETEETEDEETEETEKPEDKKPEDEKLEEMVGDAYR